MRRLAEAGLTTREACGNSVRNITACPYAGVSADELFDVTPYAEALTRYLLRHPLSSSLPRKFKIAFEGCPEDHAFTAINDIGLAGGRATGPDGREVTRFPRDRRRRHGDLQRLGLPAARVHAGGRHAQRGRGRDSRLSPPRRLPAQAPEPDEVPDQVAGVGRLARGVRSRVCRGDCRRRRAAALRSRAAAGGDGTRLAAARRAIDLGEVAARAAASPVVGPGIVPNVRPRLPVGARAGAPLAQHERAPAEAGRVRDRHGRPCRSATSRASRCASSRTCRWHSATDRSASRPTRTWCSGGCLSTRSNGCTSSSRLPARRCPTRGPSPTSRAARAPSRAALPSRSRAGLGKLLGDHLRERPGPGRRRAGRAHQDQRLPERLRPASRRRHRVPGQHPQDRRTRGARSTS